MAVTTSITSAPQYMRNGDNLPNCIGGGEDYRTVNNNTTMDFLYIRGFCGDNISDACLITKVEITGCHCKITNTSGGYATALVSGQVRRAGLLSYGNVSGTTFNITDTNSAIGIVGSFVDVVRNSTTAVSDMVCNFEEKGEQYTEIRRANKAYPGIRVEFKSSDHIRMYIKWISLTVTRTRACYITFKGDGITESKTMYDYGTVPSYGSAPTRSGYTFKGWSNGTTTYTGTLPTAYEQDVTYTAVWEKQKCTITVSAGLGGTVSGGGTYEGGATVTIKAIPNSGYKFVKWSDGNTNATRNITVTGDATYTAEFAMVYVTYDSIFSFAKWKSDGVSASNATVSNITNTGFTLTSNAGVAEGVVYSPFFSVEYGKSYKIDIDITGINWDVYIFFCDKDGNWVDFADSTNRFSYGGSGVTSRIFTAPNKSSVIKAQIRVDANGASNTVSFANFRIYPAAYEYMSDSVPAAERTDIGAWSFPTPIRDGYEIIGWNSKPDGNGETYTADSAFPCEDITLYSQWRISKVNKIYIGTTRPKDIYVGNQKIKAVYIGTTKIYG